MRQLTALVWKEWRETRAFLWIGLGVFLGLPVIAGVEGMWQYSRQFEVSALPWVVTFGAVLAVFVAVGGTSRDFNEKLEGFWRSRPIGIVRWLLVKFGVGIVVVVLACGIPLVAQGLIGFTPRTTEWDDIQYMNAEVASCLLILPAFSAGFLAGCVVCRAAHAAMLALAGVLMIYLLPVVLPPLNGFSAANIDNGASGWAYAGATLGLTAAIFLLALIAAWRGWRVESGRKMLYWLIGLSTIIAFWTAAYQLGTNMLVLSQTPLDPYEFALSLRSFEGAVYLMSEHQIPVPNAPPDQRFRYDWTIRKLDPTDAGIALGAATPIVQPFYWGRFVPYVSPAGHPDIIYEADYNSDFDDETCNLRVWTFDKEIGQPLKLWEGKSDYHRGEFATAYVWQNRLYVVGVKAWEFDITDPLEPKMVSELPISYSMWGIDESGETSALDTDLFRPNYAGSKDISKLSLLLPPIPDLPAPQKLEFAIQMRRHRAAGAFDGKILCQPFGDGLVAYKLTKLTDKSADFELIGQYSPSILQSAFGRKNYFYSAMQLSNGLLYVIDDTVWINGPANTPLRFNSGVSVFGVRDNGKHALRLVGHFGAEGARAMAVLPNGKTIVAGEKVWLIGPPPGDGGR